MEYKLLYVYECLLISLHVWCGPHLTPSPRGAAVADGPLSVVAIFVGTPRRVWATTGVVGMAADLRGVFLCSQTLTGLLQRQQDREKSHIHVIHEHLC